MPNLISEVDMEEAVTQVRQSIERKGTDLSEEAIERIRGIPGNMTMVGWMTQS